MKSVVDRALVIMGNRDHTWGGSRVDSQSPEQRDGGLKWRSSLFMSAYRDACVCTCTFLNALFIVMTFYLCEREKVRVCVWEWVCTIPDISLAEIVAQSKWKSLLLLLHLKYEILYFESFYLPMHFHFSPLYLWSRFVMFSCWRQVLLFPRLWWNEKAVLVTWIPSNRSLHSFWFQ